MNLDASHSLGIRLGFSLPQAQGSASSGQLLALKVASGNFSPKETSRLLLAPLTGATLFPVPGLSLAS